MYYDKLERLFKGSALLIFNSHFQRLSLDNVRNFAEVDRSVMLNMKNYKLPKNIIIWAQCHAMFFERVTITLQVSNLFKCGISS